MTLSPTLEHELRFPTRGSEETAAGSRFSEAIWDIDWSEHLPLTITKDGVIVAESSFEQTAPFVRENLGAMFEEDPSSSPFLQGPSTAAKVRYYTEFGDFFEFKDNGRTAGILVCTPVDWSTYYIRFCAFLPEYQGRQLLHRFFPDFFGILKRAGVERVETETSPSNLAVMHIMNRFRFNVTGTILSERWGALVRFTKFLHEESENVFLRQYCTGIRYQARPK
jgi:hypothetical protein